MKNILKKQNKHGTAAIMQIMVMVIGIIAFAYLMGSGFEGVKAADDLPPAGAEIFNIETTTGKIDTFAYDSKTQKFWYADEVTRGWVPDPGLTVADVQNDPGYDGIVIGFVSETDTGVPYLVGSNALEGIQEGKTLPPPTNIPTNEGTADIPLQYKPQADIPANGPNKGPEVDGGLTIPSNIPADTPYFPPVNTEVHDMLSGAYDIAETIPLGREQVSSAYVDAYQDSYNFQIEAGVPPSEARTNAINAGTVAADQKAAELIGKGPDAPSATTPKPKTPTEGGDVQVGAGLLKGLKWGFTVFTSIHTLGPLLGLESEETQAYANALGIASLVAGSIYGMKPKASKSAGWGVGAAIAGVIIALVIFVDQYKEVKYRDVLFDCEPWQPPIGGEFCELCNDRNLPCGEYQCKALGQSCDILNEGTDEEACAWVNRNDVKEPLISTNDAVILSEHEYLPLGAAAPNETGVILQDRTAPEGCIEAFTPFVIGITVDEPAKCKMDIRRRDNFGAMRYWIDGSSTFKYNHTHTIALPRTGNGTLELENDGNFELFIRCEDSNGNANVGEFVIKYCVQSGPDTSAPEIMGAEFGNNKPIAYDTKNLTTKIFTNEEAECKWSKEDKDYEDMENNMTECGSRNGDPVNNRPAYFCRGTFPGLKNEEVNKFYIKCKDNIGGPISESNVNVQSWEYNVIGTRPLAIDYATPNRTTIKDSSESVKVTLEVGTIEGYAEGKAICSSSPRENSSFVPFLNTDSYVHTTDLYLTEGEYDYWVSCIDLGGNEDKTKLTFEVDSDAAAPKVVRLYKEELNLRISTDEPASCVYDTKDCTYLFADGIPLTKTADQIGHYTEWNPETKLYIKCEDEFGNKPLPNECSLIVKPLEEK